MMNGRTYSSAGGSGSHQPGHTSGAAQGFLPSYQTPPPTPSHPYYAQWNVASTSSQPSLNNPAMFHEQEPAFPIIYDASRPPPPLPLNAFNGNRTRKRPAEALEAGPRKARKLEKSDNSPCEKCVRLEVRTEMYEQEMLQLKRDIESQTNIIKKKSNEYFIVKLLLKSLVSSEVFEKLEEYVETPSSLAMEDISLLESVSALAQNLVPINHIPDLQQIVNGTASSNGTLCANSNRLDIPNSGGNGFNQYINSMKPDISGPSGSTSALNTAGRTYPSAGGSCSHQPGPFLPYQAPPPTPSHPYFAQYNAASSSCAVSSNGTFCPNSNRLNIPNSGGNGFNQYINAMEPDISGPSGSTSALNTAGRTYPSAGGSGSHQPGAFLPYQAPPPTPSHPYYAQYNAASTSYVPNNVHGNRYTWSS